MTYEDKQSVRLGSGDSHEPIFSSKNSEHFRLDSNRGCMEANRVFEYFSDEVISLIFGLCAEERCRAGKQIFHRMDTSFRY